MIPWRAFVYRRDDLSCGAIELRVCGAIAPHDYATVCNDYEEGASRNVSGKPLKFILTIPRFSDDACADSQSLSARND